MIYVEAINIEARVVITEDGTAYPMEAFYDADGEECEPGEAKQIVCGADDVWFNVRPDEYERLALH